MEEKKASDLEIAMFLAEHIRNPCGVQVGNRYENIREFYIRVANERVLPTMKDKMAIDYLQKTIDAYKE